MEDIGLETATDKRNQIRFSFVFDCQPLHSLHLTGCVECIWLIGRTAHHSQMCSNWQQLYFPSDCNYKLFDLWADSFFCFAWSLFQFEKISPVFLAVNCRGSTAEAPLCNGKSFLKILSQSLLTKVHDDVCICITNKLTSFSKHSWETFNKLSNKFSYWTISSDWNYWLSPKFLTFGQPPQSPKYPSLRSFSHQCNTFQSLACDRFQNETMSGISQCCRLVAPCATQSDFQSLHLQVTKLKYVVWEANQLTFIFKCPLTFVKTGQLKNFSLRTIPFMYDRW